ncbi:MAG: hypothetical protein AB7O44_12640 [Hyphomicrobiaceae bacterium]
MAYNDPDERQPTPDYIDRADPQLGWTPIILGLAFVGVLGFLIFGTTWNSSSDRPTTTERTEVPNPAPGAPPAPAPAPPAQR